MVFTISSFAFDCLYNLWGVSIFLKWIIQSWRFYINWIPIPIRIFKPSLYILFITTETFTLLFFDVINSYVLRNMSNVNFKWHICKYLRACFHIIPRFELNIFLWKLFDVSNVFSMIPKRVATLSINRNGEIAIGSKRSRPRDLRERRRRRHQAALRSVYEIELGIWRTPNATRGNIPILSQFANGKFRYYSRKMADFTITYR